MYELPLLDYEGVWAAVRTLAPVLQAVTGTRRVVVLAAGFEVPHAHVHLMPADARKDVIRRVALTISADQLAGLGAKVRGRTGHERPNSPG